MAESANMAVVPPKLPEPTAGDMYTVAEVARFFSVSTDTIRRWCKSEPFLPHAKFGREIRFDREALQAWLDDRFHPGGTPPSDD